MILLQNKFTGDAVGGLLVGMKSGNSRTLLPSSWKQDRLSRVVPVITVMNTPHQVKT